VIGKEGNAHLNDLAADQAEHDAVLLNASEDSGFHVQDFEE
jgi:hypothetical protein